MDLVYLLSSRGIHTLSDESKLIRELDSDSIFFKSVLKEIFLDKIREEFGDEIDRNSKVDSFFLKSVRYFRLKEIEDTMDLKFPKMSMSKSGFGVTASGLLLPPICIVTYWLLNYDFILFPDFLIVLFSCIVGTSIIFFLFILLFPYKFSYLDWPDILTTNDLLNELCVDNFVHYKKDNYQLTLKGIRKLLSSGSQP